MFSPEFTIDLHVHSSQSDGLKPRFEVLMLAERRGIRSLVFTDHNLISAPDQTAAGAEKLEIETLFCGTEIFAFDAETNTKIHLLAYGDKLNTESFIFWLSDGILKRDRYYRELIAQAEHELGIELPPFVDLLSAKPIDGFSLPYPYDPSRRLISAKVIAAHIASLTGLETKTVLEQFLPRYEFEDVPTLNTAIHRVREEGGVVVLAHPFWSQRDEQKRKVIIERSVQAGIDGVEVRHPEHSHQEIRTLFELAEYSGILVTGGSDYHGYSNDDQKLGAFGITQREKDAILELIMKR